MIVNTIVQLTSPQSPIRRFLSTSLIEFLLCKLETLSQSSLKDE